MIAPAVALLSSCGEAPPPPGAGATAFLGATVFDGRSTVRNAVIVVREGRIEAFGPASTTPVPEGAERVDLAGKFVTPGWINGHGHVGGAKGLETGPEVYTEENLRDQLRLYARYGVTTVLSLGGDGPMAIALRDSQDVPDLDRARIFVAGEIVTGPTPAEARAQVAANAELGVAYIKIRVDDNLGTTKKMTPETYRAVIDEAHKKSKPVAAHFYYLEDAKELLRAGVDFLAHSVRDRAVDDELIALLKEKDVCLSPTLTREVSTFVYASEPEFFGDPFFLKAADPAVLDQLREPERRKTMRASKAATAYKKALKVAQANLKALADAGVKIVLGTDSGPPARFQGYFEHLEAELMAEAGLSPEQIFRAATADAAACLGFGDVGVIEPGRWADLAVFAENPLDDVAASKTLESVWLAGRRLNE